MFCNHSRKYQRLFSFALISFLGACSINEGKSEVCFIGDSIINLWDLDYYFNDFIIHKHAKNGARLQDVDSWEISNCNGLPTVLLIGTNNIGGLSITDTNAVAFDRYFVNEYVLRAKKIHADPLLAISILPRNFNNNQKITINQNIEKVNSALKEALLGAEINFYFINVFESFIKSNYKIEEQFFKDGLHPNDEGYGLLASKINPFL